MKPLSKTYRLPEVVGNLVKNMLKTESVDSVLARLMGEDFKAIPSEKHLGMELEMIRQEMKELEATLSIKYEREISDLQKTVDNFTNKAVELKTLHAQIHAEKREWEETKKKGGIKVSKDTTTHTQTRELSKEKPKPVKQPQQPAEVTTTLKVYDVEPAVIEQYASALPLKETMDGLTFPDELTRDLSSALVELALDKESPRREQLAANEKELFFHPQLGYFALPKKEVTKILYDFSVMVYSSFNGEELNRCEGVLIAIQNILSGDFDVQKDYVDVWKTSEEQGQWFKAMLEHNRFRYFDVDVVQRDDDYVEDDDYDYGGFNHDEEILDEELV